MIHLIETLVENSITTVLSASPVPPQARDICLNFYEFLDGEDRGSLCQEVLDGLVRLGCLFPLSQEQLPEPERSAVKLLSEDDCVSDDGTYFDRSCGLCYIVAGSDLWKKLLDLGILPASANFEPHEFSLLELAEIIVSLASKTLADGDDLAADTLGSWYVCFPLLWELAELDDDEPGPGPEPEPERIQRLFKQLAIPEVFEVAEEYCWYMKAAPIDKEKMPYFSGWRTPYEEWRDKMGITSRELCKQMVDESLSKKDFAEADRYASSMQDGSEFDRLYYRCVVGMKYYKWAKEQEINVPVLGNILSIEEVKRGFEYLAKLPIPYMDMRFCQLNVFYILIEQDKYDEAFECINAMCHQSLEQLDQESDKSDELLSQSRRVAIVVLYYRLLEEAIPDSFPGKRTLMSRKALGDVGIRKSWEVFSVLPSANPENTEVWQMGISFCEEMMQKYDL